MTIRWEFTPDDVMIHYTGYTMEVHGYTVPSKVCRSKALGILLLNGVVSVSGDLNLVECTHMFWHGVCDDCETLGWDDIDQLYDMVMHDPVFGHVVWVMTQRRTMPRTRIRKRIEEAGIWDLELLGPFKENTNDEQMEAHFQKEDR